MPKNILELPGIQNSPFKKERMYNIKRKIITDAMAALMAVQPMTAFATTELTNSTASSFAEDVTQKKVAESKETTDITGSTYDVVEEAEIYATQKFQG